MFWAKLRLCSGDLRNIWYRAIWKWNEIINDNSIEAILNRPKKIKSILLVGPVHKGHLSQWRLSNTDILWTRGRMGSSDADVRTFCAKNFGFFEIYGVSAHTEGGGWASGDIFQTRKEWMSLFRDFMQTFLMKGL